VLRTSQLRVEWSEYECTTKDWATIEFLGRAPVKTIKRLVDAWSAAERALLATVYGKASIVGSYACRDVRDGAGRSLHAFRLAPDIDPGLNRRQGSGRGWIGGSADSPTRKRGRRRRFGPAPVPRRSAAGSCSS
jgi:hypothetical protein